MVQIIHTDASLKALRALGPEKLDSGTDEGAIVNDGEETFIDHAKLATVAKELRKRDTSSGTQYGLDVLLQGTGIYIPKPPSKPEPSAEYLALMKSLRDEQDEKAYASMVGGSVDKDDSLQAITKEVNDQISVILNILFSSIFTGLAVWYATANLSTYKRREPLRVGASMLVAIIVAIAEIVLYNSYKQKMADAQRRERATEEVKTLVIDEKSD
ncbi:hypothetical protein ABW19_dt0201489 [Dactylella cylindrospora]|nr:hypothetical protein ABW19_dt0201489 [Dactylella cylindrospora]